MRNIKILFTEADRARLQPLFEQLRAKGLRVQEAGDTLKTSEVVLAVLSENAYADRALVDRVLGLIGAGAETVLPLQLDGAAMPDALKNALYARNIIFAAERDDKLIAERIVDALPKKKNRLPLILSIAAVAFIAAAGLLIWRAAQSRETVPVLSEDAVSVLVSAGLTEEDLAEVRCVAIMGEHFAYYTEETRLQRPEGGDQWPDMLYELASEQPAPQSRAWYSHEDGSEVHLTAYDLGFLSLMPNLEELHICLADITRTPDLSGLQKLTTVWLYDSRVDSLDWLADSHVGKVQIECDDLDLSPLGRCQDLQCAILSLHSSRSADLSAFSPPKLRELGLVCGFSPDGYHDTDLSGLAACGELESVRLNGLDGVTELSFLQGKSKLQRLELRELGQLRDISALGTLTSLRELEIDYCPSLTDYTPIAGCTALVSIHVQGDYNPDALRDASFLAELPNLIDIGLYSCNLRNMDFLEGIAQHQLKIQLGFAGQIADYSGLAAIKNYRYLHVNPRRTDTRYGDFSAVLPYIRDAEIDNLMLYDCYGVDLAELPRVNRNLSIRYGNLTDLSGLQDYKISRLELWDCQYLSSLEGVQALPRLKEGSMELDIAGCSRLTDFSALEGAYLENLKLTGLYVLPDLGTFRTRGLRLERIEELTELSCLDALSGTDGIELQLVGLDALTDLTPVYRLHGGTLVVPPQVADQAEELVANGNFRSYEVQYPDGGWQPNRSEVVLLSLDELSTLPRALLKRVGRVTIAGDQILDEQRYDINERWENGEAVPVLHDRETGEETLLEQGTITDLSLFSGLAGLRCLRLYNQPLASLDGIQELESLEEFAARWCPALEDASPLFALQGLRDVDLQSTAVASIQGIQNLSELHRLDISRTYVTDLTPLQGCDLSAAEEQGGLDLSLNELELDAEDFAALGTVRRYSNLNFTNADPAVWLPALADSEIGGMGAAGDLHTDADLAAFAADHPELRSLWLGWVEGITDLTPLLALKDLERVGISQNMEAAIHSLDGQSYGFELQIQG